MLIRADKSARGQPRCPDRNFTTDILEPSFDSNSSSGNSSDDLFRMSGGENGAESDSESDEVSHAESEDVIDGTTISSAPVNRKKKVDVN